MRLLPAWFLGLLFMASPGLFPAAAQEYLVRNWQTEDGLPDNTVTAIQQTSDGYLWLGTFNGLVRFDGVQFRTFDSANTPELSSSRILSLLSSPEGDLWVGTEGGGLVTLSGRVFKKVALGSFGKADSVTALFPEESGAVWASVAGKGVARLQGGRVEVFENATIATNLARLSRDPAVQAWLGAREDLLVFRAGSWFSRPSQVPPKGSEIIAVQRSRNRSTWLAYPRRLENLSNKEGVRRTSRDWGQDFSSALVTGLVEDRLGQLWVGTLNNGLFHSTGSGGFASTTAGGPLAQNVISALYEDGDGLIWAGTYRAGLFRIKRPNVQTLRPPGASGVNVQTICTGSDGGVWLGTGGAGLYRYAQDRFTAFAETNGLANLHVCSVFEDSRSNLWVGTWGGLFLREGERFRRAGTEELPERVLALYEDHQGDLWVGTYGGLARKQGSRWTLFTTTNGLSHPDVRALAEDPQGNLWVGTAGGGLDRLRDGRFTHFGPEEGFPHKMVVALDADPEGGLWIGTIGGGLVRFKEGRFTSYTTQDGLADNIVGGILEDGLGNLWLSSQNGILRVSKHALSLYERGVSPPLPCLSLSVGDGLSTPMCSGAGQPVGARAGDGRLWVPNMKAAAVFDPRAVGGVRRAAPQVIIEDLAIDGRNYEPPRGGALRVPYGKRQFEFRYTALGSPAPEAVRFRCKLEGVDKEWLNVGVRRYAYYGMLAPGSYSFQVMAAGSDGLWREAPGPLRLEVVPHLWELRWFQVLAGMVLVAAAASVVFLNERRKLRRRLERAELLQSLEQERRRIARDLHDDLGARLTEIVLMGEVAKRAVPATSAAQQQLGGIVTNIRQLVLAMEAVVWTVDPRNDLLPRLATFLGDHTERFLLSTGMACRLDIDENLPPVLLSAQARHNVLLTVKEALNNAAKHSGASKVWLRIRAEESRVCILVTDNGRGFDPQGPLRPGNGLQNMQTRMESVQGRIEIQSEPGKGTTVSLWLPLLHRPD